MGYDFIYSTKHGKDNLVPGALCRRVKSMQLVTISELIFTFLNIIHEENKRQVHMQRLHILLQDWELIIQ